MHVSPLSSVHPHNFDATTHKFATKEDEESRIVRSRGVTFVMAYVVWAVLELSPDGISTPIDKVACRAYRLLMRLDSCVLDYS